MTEKLFALHNDIFYDDPYQKSLSGNSLEQHFLRRLFEFVSKFSSFALQTFQLRLKMIQRLLELLLLSTKHVLKTGQQPF